MPSEPEPWFLDTPLIGRRMLVYDRLASTNTTAAELALAGNADGLVVIARHQTAGRGQYGRVWQSRPGASLLLSAVVLPPADLRRPALLTGFAASAVAEAVFALAGVQARIKWPNDLLVSGKKVCGILIEQHGPAAVIGIGLNLTQSADEFAAAGLPHAASLASVSGKGTDLRTAAETVIRRLDQDYGRLRTGERTEVEADWKRRIGLLGRSVRLDRMDGSTLRGRLLEMEFDRLLIELPGGSLEGVIPETVRHLTGA
jgi:BirA family biotin operon repressor/biotin-[acetyl-CoA-carboxylase] ligase